MKIKRINSGDKFDHFYHGKVEVISARGKTVCFKGEDGNSKEQHLNYFLMHCGKIKMDVYVPAFADTIFTILENKYNYKVI